MKNKKGFTLIELMVVISIIALLSSVVLAALQDARKKGIDGNIKTQLNHFRTQASNFYANGNTYAGLCADTSLGMKTMALAAAKQIGAASVGDDTAAWSYTTTPAVCHDTANGWALIISLKKPTAATGGWCVDSTLNAKEVTVLTSNGSADGGSVLCGQ